MARYGFSPPTRVFEAAGAGACVITDAWDGIEQFLASGVFLLKIGEINGKCQRIMAVKKMRGTPVEPSDYPFMLRTGDGIVLADRPLDLAAASPCEAPMFEYFQLKHRF